MEPVNYIKEMLKVEEGTVIDGAVDLGLSTIPLLGSAFQNYRIRKLEIRMKNNIHQLEIIKDKVESSNNEVFYKSEVFPLIVNQIMNEDEDTKAKVIIDGFEHIVDNDLDKIEKIYHYYDVLAEMRYSDILRFARNYTPYEWRDALVLDMDFFDYNDLTPEQKTAYHERKAIETYQKNKYLRLGLLDSQTFTESTDGSIVINIDKDNGIQTGISEFGKQFLMFFTITDD